MSDLFQLNAAALMADSRPELHRVLRAMELAGGSSYMDSYDRFARGLEEAGAGATVRQVLQAADVKQLDAIAEDVKTLERADEARAQIHERVAGMFELDGPDRAGTGVSGHGAHSADPQEAPRLDAKTFGEIKRAQPGPHYERLFQARQLPGGSHYATTRGGEQFARDDGMMADGGLDLVGAMRRNGQAQTAQETAATASRRLDQALERGKTPAERRKLLDAVLSDELKQLEEVPSAKPPVDSSDTARHLAELRELDDGSDAEYTRYLDALDRAGRG